MFFFLQNPYVSSTKFGTKFLASNHVLIVNKYKDPCSDKLVKKNQVHENEKKTIFLAEREMNRK